MILGLTLIEFALFLGLGLHALALAKTGPSRTIWRLWWLAVPPVVAVLVGSGRRLLVQAVQVGGQSNIPELLNGQMRAAQSIVVIMVGGYTFVAMRRLASRMYELEAIVGDMVERVESVPVQDLKLTPREREVLEAIRVGSRIDDRSLTDRLSIAPGTVHTHVSSLLRKTKLNDRRDLTILAFILRDSFRHR